MQSPQQPPVMPAPVPVAFSIATVESSPDQIPRTSMILVQVHSVTGTSTYFLPLDGAEKVASMITDAVRMARTGLVVPNGGIARA